jgi:hypothetical protein
MGDQYTWVWVAVVFALVWFMLGLLLHILAERRTQQERRSKIRTDDLFLSCSIVLLAKAVFTLALTVRNGADKGLMCEKPLRTQ